MEYGLYLPWVVLDSVSVYRIQIDSARVTANLMERYPLRMNGPGRYDLM